MKPDFVPVSDRLKPESQNSFTVVELLVVIAILALLAALLLPSLQGARTRAKFVVCASNIHQIGIAMAGYAGDYRDWFPAPNAAISSNGVMLGGPAFYYSASSG